MPRFNTSTSTLSQNTKAKILGNYTLPSPSNKIICLCNYHLFYYFMCCMAITSILSRKVSLCSLQLLSNTNTHANTNTNTNTNTPSISHHDSYQTQKIKNTDTLVIMSRNSFSTKNKRKQKREKPPIFPLIQVPIM